MNMCRFDPFATFECRAVDTILCVIFLVLPIPLHFELGVEQLLDMSQRDVLLTTAFWWHVSWIFD